MKTWLKYDDAIEYFRQYPEAIQTAWHQPTRHPAGSLFAFLTKTGTRLSPDIDFWDCGCPSMIKESLRFNTSSPELTEAVRNMVGIPAHSDEITVNHLPAFKEAQELADRLILGRDIFKTPRTLMAE